MTPGKKKLFSIVLTVFGLVVLCTPASSESGYPVESISVSDFDGLIQKKEGRRMIVFLAAWCGPCIRELPTLIKLCDKYRPSGLEIIGISLDWAGSQAIQPILEEMKVNFKVFWVGDSIMKKYDIRSIPLIYFMRDGEVVDRIVGNASEAVIEKRIRKLLNP